jgi:KaiC/GvpD/RAD55 family RecA-like ATPase
MKPSVKEDFPKSHSGIEGLDEITGGGLPKGRPTLIYGSAGCGKTLMAWAIRVKAQRLRFIYQFIIHDVKRQDTFSGRRRG